MLLLNSAYCTPGEPAHHISRINDHEPRKTISQTVNHKTEIMGRQPVFNVRNCQCVILAKVGYYLYDGGFLSQSESSIKSGIAHDRHRYPHSESKRRE